LRQHNAKRNIFRRRRLDDSGAIDYVVNVGLWKDKKRHFPPPRQRQRQEEDNEEEDVVGEEQEEWKAEHALKDERMLENENSDEVRESRGGGGGHQRRRGNNIREIAQKVHDGYMKRGDALFQDGGGESQKQYNQDKPPNPAGKKKRKKKNQGGGTGNSRRGNRGGGRRSPPKRQGGQGRIDRGEPVEKRYGKWMKALKDKPHILKKLEEAGMEGLKEFGYEPKQRFLDYKELDYQCDDTVVCKAKEEKQ